jgi:hypothetical protein
MLSVRSDWGMVVMVSKILFDDRRWAKGLSRACSMGSRGCRTTLIEFHPGFCAGGEGGSCWERKLCAAIREFQLRVRF